MQDICDSHHITLHHIVSHHSSRLWHIYRKRAASEIWVSTRIKLDLHRTNQHPTLQTHVTASGSRKRRLLFATISNWAPRHNSSPKNSYKPSCDGSKFTQIASDSVIKKSYEIGDQIPSVKDGKWQRERRLKRQEWRELGRCGTTQKTRRAPLLTRSNYPQRSDAKSKTTLGFVAVDLASHGAHLAIPRWPYSRSERVVTVDTTSHGWNPSDGSSPSRPSLWYLSACSRSSRTVSTAHRFDSSMCVGRLILNLCLHIKPITMLIR